MFYGPHLSIADGYLAVIDEMKRLGISACQIYSASRSNSAKQLNEEVRPIAASFKEKCEQENLVVVSHNSLVSNIASSVTKTWAYSKLILQSEVFRCSNLGIKYIVLHPGSNEDRKEGISQIISALNSLKMPEGVKILLETMPGSGNQIGANKDDFVEIFAGLDNKDNFGICFDTAHCFTAVDNIKEYYLSLCEDFDVPVIHFNNSCKPKGSHKDGHANLSKGNIPLNEMVELYNTFKDKVIIFEQPIKTQSNDEVVEDFRINIQEGA